MGSGRVDHESLAAPLGRLLARRGVHLLTGGGAGVMASVSRAFAETRPREGLVVGVLPGRGTSASTERAAHAARPMPPDGYPNPWVELTIRTHLPWSGERGDEPLSRNHINVLSSDLVVALPGGAGTASEVRLALRYGVPVVALGDAARPEGAEAPSPIEVFVSIEALDERLDALLARSR